MQGRDGMWGTAADLWSGLPNADELARPPFRAEVDFEVNLFHLRAGADALEKPEGYGDEKGSVSLVSYPTWSKTRLGVARLSHR